MEEIVDMYITDAKDMLKELSDVFSDEKLAGAEDGKPDYNLARAVLHKLKGSSSTFGADGVQQKCEELREHCINEVGKRGKREGMEGWLRTTEYYFPSPLLLLFF